MSTAEDKVNDGVEGGWSTAGDGGGVTVSSSLTQMAELMNQLGTDMASATAAIRQITTRSRMLALNARIEAARAGGAIGAAFDVVASEMSELAGRTAEVAGNLKTESEQLTQRILGRLSTLNTHLETIVKGEQLATAALTTVDLIDRNLYERSCDCRWWATDAAAVDVLTAVAENRPSDQVRQAVGHANMRLGVILDAYTVYYDIVLADTRGRLIARGRPEQFPLDGVDVSQSRWFQAGMSTPSGNDFGFHSMHSSPLVNGREVLIYSAAVREGGQRNGRPLGVLGVIFNWRTFAEKIVMQMARSDDGSQRRVVVVEGSGRVLADSITSVWDGRFDFAGMSDMLVRDRNYGVASIAGTRSVVGHAQSPGFETYRTGWHAFAISPMVEISFELGGLSAQAA